MEALTWRGEAIDDNDVLEQVCLSLSLVLGGVLGRETEVEKVWAVVEKRLLDDKIGVSKFEVTDPTNAPVVPISTLIVWW